MTEALQSFLDSGSSFEGKVSFTGVVRIDGHFRGDASADGTLVIGETGVVEADLKVATLVVNGTFNGHVTAKDRVEVGATGRISGGVTTPRLTVIDGAQINAELHMGEGAEVPRAPSSPDPA